MNILFTLALVALIVYWCKTIAPGVKTTFQKLKNKFNGTNNTTNTTNNENTEN